MSSGRRLTAQTAGPLSRPYAAGKLVCRFRITRELIRGTCGTENSAKLVLSDVRKELAQEVADEIVAAGGSVGFPNLMDRAPDRAHSTAD